MRIEGQVKAQGYEAPTKVEWWAGKAFRDVVTVTKEEDPSFGARFTYWGPMLIQAKLHWADGESALAHIFAPLPPDVSASEDGRA